MDKIAGVILAGGLSARMGGGNKSLLDLGGQPILSHVVARLREQCFPIAINANSDAARFAEYGLPVLADVIKGFPGPLAGLLTAMHWAAGQGASHVVTVAGDTPFFPLDLAVRLHAAAQLAQAPAAIPESPDENGIMRHHPAIGMWPVWLEHDLRSAIDQGARKIGQWALQQGAAKVTFCNETVDPFFNINTPDDLRRAHDLLEAMK